MSLTVTLHHSFITQNQFVREPGKRSFVFRLPQGLDLIYITAVSCQFCRPSNCLAGCVHPQSNLDVTSDAGVDSLTCKSLYCFNHKVTGLTFFFLLNLLGTDKLLIGKIIF